MGLSPPSRLLHEHHLSSSTAKGLQLRPISNDLLQCTLDKQQKTTSPTLARPAAPLAAGVQQYPCTETNNISLPWQRPSTDRKTNFRPIVYGYSSTDTEKLAKLGMVDSEITGLTHTHPFNGNFSGTTQVSRHQKGKTDLDFTEARDSEWQWHQRGPYASLHLAPDR